MGWREVAVWDVVTLVETHDPSIGQATSSTPSTRAKQSQTRTSGGLLQNIAGSYACDRMEMERQNEHSNAAD